MAECTEYRVETLLEKPGGLVKEKFEDIFQPITFEENRNRKTNECIARGKRFCGCGCYQFVEPGCIFLPGHSTKRKSSKYYLWRCGLCSEVIPEDALFVQIPYFSYMEKHVNVCVKCLKQLNYKIEKAS